MECPRCPGTVLLLSNRDGVEIDYCPQCRGVWLDRGELDKIIERSEVPYRPSPVAAADRRDRDDDRRGWDDDDRRDWDDDDRRDWDDDDRRDWDDDAHVNGAGRKRKRKGFLSELFEFGD